MTSKKISFLNEGISGIILLPLLIWFLISCIGIFKDPIGNLPVFFYKPVNAILGIMFSIFITLYVISEIKCNINIIIKNKNIKILLVSLLENFVILTIIALILSILQLHLSGIFNL